MAILGAAHKHAMPEWTRIGGALGEMVPVIAKVSLGRSLGKCRRIEIKHPEGGHRTHQGGRDQVGQAVIGVEDGDMQMTAEHHSHLRMLTQEPT